MDLKSLGWKFLSKETFGDGKFLENISSCYCINMFSRQMKSFDKVEQFYKKKSVCVRNFEITPQVILHFD